MEEQAFHDCGKRFLFIITKSVDKSKIIETTVSHLCVITRKHAFHSVDQIPRIWQERILFLESGVKTVDFFEESVCELKMTVNEVIREKAL